LAADRGYDGKAFRLSLAKRGIRHSIPLRRAPFNGKLKYRPRTHRELSGNRWVVERLFAWLNGFRRITQRFERYAFMYEALLHLACCWICLRRLLQWVLAPYRRLLSRAKPTEKGELKSVDLVYPAPTDVLFPGSHIKMFNGLLDRAKLKHDRDGNPRTAYSLRHTYICMRLMEGADIYQIAKNCRTSVEMIEKFYAAHIKNMLDAAAINVRRPRRNPELKMPFVEEEI
jgi:transposase